MDNNKVYLKSNIQAVPLTHGWYAWSYLIPPLTSAFYISCRHLKIMESFVECPEIHHAMAQNQNLTGSSFMDLPVEKVPIINSLIQQTYQNCSNLLNLKESLDLIKKLILTDHNGESLEKLYSHIPDNLKGLLEFTYDLYGNKSVRFFEELIYKKFYSTNFQSILFAPINTDNRPFVLSTPYLINNKGINLNIPFKDNLLDEIFASKVDGINLSQFFQNFQLSAEEVKNFKSFFNNTPIKLNKDRNYTGEGMRIRYFGHACVLLQTKNYNILIDPLISYSYNSTLDRFNFDDLPDKINYVCITHNHQDHIQIETLLQLRHKIEKIIVPQNLPGELADPSIKLLLKHIGFTDVLEIQDFQNIECEEIRIISIPFLGEHGDLAIKSKTSFLIENFGKKILFAADSKNLDNYFYEHVHSLYGSIDTIFIGMECEGAPISWLYGPLLQTQLNRQAVQSRRLSGSDSEGAIKLATTLKVKHAYVYALGLEPWLSNIMGLKKREDMIQLKEARKFLQLCQSNDIIAEILYGKKEWMIT